MPGGSRGGSGTHRFGSPSSRGIQSRRTLADCRCGSSSAGPRKRSTVRGARGSATSFGTACATRLPIRSCPSAKPLSRASTSAVRRSPKTGRSRTCTRSAFPSSPTRSKTGFTYWGRTPTSEGGRVAIQVREHGHWRNAAVARADGSGIFQGAVTTAYGRGEHGMVRARYRGEEARPLLPAPGQGLLPGAVRESGRVDRRRRGGLRGRDSPARDLRWMEVVMALDEPDYAITVFGEVD